MKQLFLIITLFIFCNTQIIAGNYLFHNGTSNYKILITPTDTTAKTAAIELQKYIFKISKVKLPIVTNATTNYILIQESKNTGESFHYYSDGTNISIIGDKGRGLFYGVYNFLEQQFDIHWFTPNYTSIKFRHLYRLKKLSIKSQPAFKNRLLFFYDALRSNDWCVHNLLNTQSEYVKNDYGNLECWWGMHTFEALLPQKKYFKSHPEYFSLYNGKRISNGQPCLSNPQVEKIITENIIKEIEKYPYDYVYDVSQNDNQKYCQCDKCTAIAKQYGGQSGILVWFVNKIARSVRKIYPNKMIGTFAYRYTRSAPQNITIESNVAIRLCSFECCFSHDLTNCKLNESFMNDMEDWLRLTPNIHIYDYCAGFQQYIAPLPYFRPMADRLKVFHNSGIKSILELGEYDGQWGDFSEMKQWVAAKLMWNPNQNVDSLCHIFINNYYGKAKDYIWKFYCLTQDIAKPSNHFTIYCDYKNAAFTRDYMSSARNLTDKALKAVKGDTTLQKRVNRVAALIYYLEVMNNPLNSRKDGTLDKLKKIEFDDPTYFREHKQSLDDTMKHWGYI